MRHLAGQSTDCAIVLFAVLQVGTERCGNSEAQAQRLERGVRGSGHGMVLGTQGNARCGVRGSTPYAEAFGTVYVA